jgi:hypothetical protein
MTATQRKTRPALRLVRHSRPLKREKLYREALHLSALSAGIMADIMGMKPMSTTPNRTLTRQIEGKLRRLVTRATRLQRMLP